MIVVTGAAGRLGRLVVGRLIERGYEVLGTDQLPYDGSPSPFVQADLCDWATTTGLLHAIPLRTPETTVKRIAHRNMAILLP